MANSKVRLTSHRLIWRATAHSCCLASYDRSLCNHCYSDTFLEVALDALCIFGFSRVMMATERPKTCKCGNSQPLSSEATDFEAALGVVGFGRGLIGLRFRVEGVSWNTEVALDSSRRLLVFRCRNFRCSKLMFCLIPRGFKFIIFLV